MINTEAARALIAEGEGQRIEFKQSFAEENEAIISLCAFCHADGGTVFFGVKDNGEIVGAHLGRNTLENLANNIRTATQPPLTTSIEKLELDGRVIVAVMVPKVRPDELIYAFNTPYTRVGRTNQVMVPQQQRARVRPSPYADDDDMPLQRPELPTCFQPDEDAFSPLIARNFLFEFAGSGSNYLELLSADLRRVFFHLFNKHLRSGIINHMLVSGHEGSGKTFNTLLLSLKLSSEGYRVFYSQDIRATSLTGDHLRAVATRGDKFTILIIDNVQHDVVKAENLVNAISQVAPYTGKPVFFFLTRPLDKDTFIDTFGANTPILSMVDRFIDFEHLVSLFFQSHGTPEAARTFLRCENAVRLPSFLFEHRNMAFWNEVLRSLPRGMSWTLTEEQIVKRAHAFFRRRELPLLASQESLARLLPFFCQGIAIHRDYACEIIGKGAEDALHQLEGRGYVQIVEQDWETDRYDDTSALVVEPHLHATKAKLLTLVFRKYYGYSVDPTEAIADYAERFLHNLHYILAAYHDPEDLRALVRNPRISSLIRCYFLERHLGKKLGRVIQRVAILDEGTRNSLLDEQVIKAFAEKVNGDRAYLVSKMNLFRMLYRACPRKSYDLFCLLAPDAVSRTFLADDHRRSSVKSLSKFMEVFKNIYYHAPTPDAKAQIQSYVKRVIDECRSEFVRRFGARHPFFTEMHWILKRLHGLKLADYFLEGIPPEKLIELIRTKDTNVVELVRFVLFEANYTMWTAPDGSQERYYDIMRENLMYDDLKRIFDNGRSDLHDLVMNATDELVAKALVRYVEDVNFKKKAASETVYLRKKSLRQVRSNWFLTDAEKDKVVRTIVKAVGKANSE